MANRAYVSLWSKGFSEATMLEQFQQLLTTVPLSAERPGFTELVIRAVDPTETPLVERDLRGKALSAAELIELAAEYLHADSEYEVRTHWELWVYDAERGRGQRRAQRLALLCHGDEYDGGSYLFKLTLVSSTWSPAPPDGAAAAPRAPPGPARRRTRRRQSFWRECRSPKTCANIT